MIDGNNDGSISKVELTTLLKGIGKDISDVEIDDMMKAADEN